MIKTNNVKYTVQYAKRFKKEYKKMLKQGKDKTKFWKVVNTIVSGKELAEKYKWTYVKFLDTFFGKKFICI